MAKTYQLQTLARALDVLELIERSPEPLSLTEIASAMNEAKTIVYRILGTLEARGYLYRRADKRYGYTGRGGGAATVSMTVEALRGAARHMPAGVTARELAGEAAREGRLVSEVLIPLSEKGLIGQDPDSGRWRLSPAVVQLARPFLQGDDVLLHVRALMERLHGEIGETVSLYHRSGNEQVVTWVLPSPHPVRYALEVGSVFPLYLGAAGKAMLAFLPEAEAESLIGGETLVAPTRYVPSASRLRREFNLIRRTGFAQSSGERVEGVSAVAAPIRRDDGYPLAVLGLMMPSFRTDDARMRRLGEELVDQLNALRIPSPGRDAQSLNR